MKRLLAMLRRLIPRDLLVQLRGKKSVTLNAAAEMNRLRRAIEKQIDTDERRVRRG